jgi:hypothetical protein
MWKPFKSLTSLKAKSQKIGRDEATEVEHRLLKRPSREDVLHGFRLILGREPEDENAIRAHMLVPSVGELRQILLNSDEFKGKYQSMRPEMYGHPSLSMERETVVFIHLQKTGGTSLRVMLAGQFPTDRRCPILQNELHLLSVAELGRYDFFSGHFDQSSVRFIPRNNIKTVALFREPRARLISLYRFLRAHPVSDEFANDTLIRIANESTAEEFFESAETRSFPAVYNHYLVAFGGSFPWFDHNRASLSKEDYSSALAVAKRQIRALTALGITERFGQSLEFICKALALRPPSSMENLHVTDKFADLDARFRPVDPVTMTPRLFAALEELTAYDDELYRLAVEEFERRLAESSRAKA